ncbi:MAG: hypothetical protein LBU75_09010, partial [Desulfovibrio sp.]|nr:hypothetical protein [Desulfovibrio sp.]
MPSQSSPDGTAARALRAADPTLRPHPTPLFRSPQPRPHGIAAWLCRCLLGVALCAVLAACASSGQTGPSGVADPSGVTGVLGQSGTASGAAMGTARDAASAAPSHGQTGSKADGQTGGTAPASPAMARDGLPTGLPF